MKYVVVNWTATNETSVMEESSVRDVSMLTNPRKKGMIYYKEIGKKNPKGGLKAYVGRVVSVHDTLKEARKSETEFLLEDKENFNSLQQVSKKRRRNNFLSSDEESNSDADVDDSGKANEKTVSVQQRRKMAEMLSAENLIGENNWQCDTEGDDLKKFSRDQLVREVKRLRQELIAEKSKRKLCDELPRLLVEALSSPNVLKKLRQLYKEEAVQEKRLKITEKISDMTKKSREHNHRSNKASVTLPPNKPCSETSTATPETLPVQRREDVSSVTPEKASSSIESRPFNSLPRITSTPNTPPVGTSQASGNVSHSPATPASSSSAKTLAFHQTQLHELLTPNALAEVERSKTFSKMTKTLLSAVFGREVLTKSTLIGKSRDGEGEALDPSKVEVIVAYVMQSFPFATRSAVRLAMSQKLKDERKACERMQKSEVEKKN